MSVFFTFTNTNQNSKKKLKNIIRLVVPAKGATMSPPIGPVLGQYGINIMEFCKQFNEKTKDFHDGVLLTVLIYQFADKTFNFVIKNFVNSFLIKELLPLTAETDTRLNKLNILNVKDAYYLSLLNKRFFSLSDKVAFSNLVSIIKSCNVLLGR
jgi:large subunit ribosomal protein L11